MINPVLKLTLSGTQLLPPLGQDMPQVLGSDDPSFLLVVIPGGIVLGQIKLSKSRHSIKSGVYGANESTPFEESFLWTELT